MPGEWLSLSEAANMLGVHTSTVRSWSDQGYLPVHRTHGGHRRYVRGEIELWQETQRTGEPADVGQILTNALRNTRFQISEGRLNAEAWYGKLDEEARAQYRRSGRTLLEGLLAYMTSDARSGIAEADAVGYEYASRGWRYGLSALDATNAFLFFRDVLLETMLSVYEAAAVRSPQAWGGMFRKMNDFTERILVKLLETYEAYNRSNR